MIIDNDQATTTMRVNFNFTFLRAPCLGLSFDQQDEIGNHKLDVSDTLQKIRVHKNGEIIPRVIKKKAYIPVLKFDFQFIFFLSFISKLYQILIQIKKKYYIYKLKQIF